MTWVSYAQNCEDVTLMRALRAPLYRQRRPLAFGDVLNNGVQDGAPATLNTAR